MQLVCERRSSFTTTLGCFVPAGSMHERPEERGSALFLQHLFFGRTVCKNQEQLEVALQEIGGKVAAIAMRDMFLFYGTVPSHRIDKLVQFFADVILNGVICDGDVRREKHMILHELGKMESDRERVVMDYLPTMAYQDTTLANSIYPTTVEIKNFSTESLNAFRSRLFQPCFMTMVCSGSICLNDLERTINKYFPSEPSSNVSNLTGYSAKPLEYRFSGAELRLRDDDEELGYVAVAVEGPGYEQRDHRFALNVAKEIVGAWDRTCSGVNHNAPYIAHCAYNTELCCMYRSFFHDWARTTSIWGCYYVCEKLMLEDMMFAIQQQWMRLCTTITQKEVSRAVNQCKTKELLILNDPLNRFLDIVKNLYRYRDYKPVDQRVAEYERITADKIREIADKYIYDQSPAVIATGRIENLPDYCRIRSGMYLLRY